MRRSDFLDDTMPPFQGVLKTYTIRKALANPAVKESLGKLGAEQNLMEPRTFDSEIGKEIAANVALVKAAGIPISSP